jgi:hypothetical protein
MQRESLTELSKLLKSELLAEFPEWQKHIAAAKSKANAGSFSTLYIKIPCPADETRFLSISDRGDCLEIGFYDGDPPGPAESQIHCCTGAAAKCVAEAIDFVKEITEEKFVAGRERMWWFFGNKLAPPQFVEAQESEKKKLVRVRSWKGDYDREIEK